MSDADIARRLGKGSREAIVNTRRLLNLIPEAQQALLRQQISAGHGRALLKLKETEQQQQALAVMLSDDWTVREAERFGDLVKELGDLDEALATIREQRSGRSEQTKQNRRTTPATTPKRQDKTTAEDQDIKHEMERILGTPVSLARTDKDLRVTIVFHTDDKLQEFFDLLNAT